MVFCYKIITESPQRSPSSKKSTARKIYPNSTSELIGIIDSESRNASVLGSIPEREWRLITALVRKRCEEDEREELASQFRRMWQKEKEEREIVEAETSEQYKRFVQAKRCEERAWREHRRGQRNAGLQMWRKQLMDYIQHKEQRAQHNLACLDDEKLSRLADGALEGSARALIAADRRDRLGAADSFRRHANLSFAEARADEAAARRRAFLHDQSQRLATSNALNIWETSLVRQELCAIEMMRREQLAAVATLRSARGARAARARSRHQARARRIAAVTAVMRDTIRNRC